MVALGGPYVSILEMSGVILKKNPLLLQSLIYAN